MKKFVSKNWCKMMTGSSLVIASLFTFILFSLSSCGGCGDCMMCDGKGKTYFDMTGEVACPNCGGDGCSSDGENGSGKSGAELWEEKYGK